MGLRLCVVVLSLIPAAVLAQEPAPQPESTPVDVGLGVDFAYEPSGIGVGRGVHLAMNGRGFDYFNVLIDIGLHVNQVAVKNLGRQSSDQTLRRLSALAGVHIAPPRDTTPYADVLVGLRRQFFTDSGVFSSGERSGARRVFESTAFMFQPAGGMQFALSPTLGVRAEVGLVIGRNFTAEQSVDLNDHQLERPGLFAWRFSAVMLAFTGRH
jgi:hypothetical protein